MIVSGLLVIKYKDLLGRTLFSFASIANSLASGARNIYRNRSKEGYTDIEFAPIPLPVSNLYTVQEKLVTEYLKTCLDNQFEKLKPWITGKRKDKSSLDFLDFQKPFRIIPGKQRKKGTFAPYRERPGIYFFKELTIERGVVVKEELVYLGISPTGNMGRRIKDRFYPNKHLYYKEILGKREYLVAAVEVQKNRRETDLAFEKRLDEIETILIRVFDPRDNKEKKKSFEEDLTTLQGGYVPVLKEGEEGF
ncbi:MAG: hypothetical protein AAB681_01525 [Patescibacteria group bacterium]